MADISYTPTTWADGSGGGTPIDATKLNNIESGIVDAVAAIGPNDTTVDGTLKEQIDARLPMTNTYKTATTDSIGRIQIDVPISKLLNVTVENTSAYCIPRHVMNGVNPETLVYIRDITSNNPVANTSQKIYYSYIG